MSPSSRITNLGNSGQFKLVKDTKSSRVNDLKKKQDKTNYFI